MNDSNPPNAAPRFAVIMPVYNHAAYVGQAIASVRAQTVADWELVVVDDGSTDGSSEAAARAAADDGRITIVRQANAGPSAARNAAIARSGAAWLTFLDSDDVWYDGALAAFADAIAAKPEAAFHYGFRHRLNSDGSVTELPGEFQDRPTGPAELFGRMFLSHLCVCFRRDLIGSAGGYDETLRSCEDYDLYLRMGLISRFVPIGRATGLRRRHGTNISRQTGPSRFLEAEVLRRFVDARGGRAVVGDDLIGPRLHRLYYAAGRQYFRAGNFRAAHEALAEASRYGRSVKAMGLKCLGWFLRPAGGGAGDLPRLT